MVLGSAAAVVVVVVTVVHDKVEEKDVVVRPVTASPLLLLACDLVDAVDVPCNSFESSLAIVFDGCATVLTGTALISSTALLLFIILMVSTGVLIKSVLF